MQNDWMGHDWHRVVHGLSDGFPLSLPASKHFREGVCPEDSTVFIHRQETGDLLLKKDNIRQERTLRQRKTWTTY